MNFSSNALKLARESRGFTQSSLASDTKISQARISRFEHGFLDPDHQEVLLISELLNYPIEFFTQPVNVLQTGLIYNRAKKRVSKKKLTAMQSRSIIKEYRITKLLESFDIDRDIPDDFDYDRKSNTPEEMAQRLRRYWNIPCGPISNLCRVIEKAGIMVIKEDFGFKELDGFFMNANTPIIFINNSFPNDRHRFTLAHELGHIMMHRKGGDEDIIEQEADAFASELLMPSDEMRDVFNSFRGVLNIRVLAQIKAVWKCSMASILRKSHATLTSS